MCNKETGGHWDESEIDCHINIKEILAVKFSLNSFVSHFKSISVKIYIDNTTIVAAIRHMGTSHSDIINKSTKDVWEWCIERDICLIPTYICSRDNFADLPSRKTYLDGKWMLNIDIFNKAMLDLHFKPDVGLFASRLNKQLDRFVSFKPDPEAIDADAFSISRTNLKFYAFLPFSCISRCFQKITMEKATGVIVVPNWTTQPFYSVLLRMLVKGPIVIKKNKHNFVMPGHHKMKSKIAKRSDLLICLVSGAISSQLDHKKAQ